MLARLQLYIQWGRKIQNSRKTRILCPECQPRWGSFGVGVEDTIHEILTAAVIQEVECNKATLRVYDWPDILVIYNLASIMHPSLPCCILRRKPLKFILWVTDIHVHVEVNSYCISSVQSVAPADLDVYRRLVTCLYHHSFTDYHGPHTC